MGGALITAGLLAWLGLFAGVVAARAEPGSLRIVTAEYPPFTMIGADGAIGGMMTEIVIALHRRVGATEGAGPAGRPFIELLPWKRAYDEALRDPNVLLYPLAITPDREPLFEPLGVVVPREVWLFRDRDGVAPIPAAAGDLAGRPVGAVGGLALADRLAREYGARIDESLDERMLLRKLLRDRVPYIAHDPFVMRWALAGFGDEPDATRRVEPVLKLFTEGYRSVAMAKGADPARLRRLRLAFEALRQDGSLDRIVAGYRAGGCLALEAASCLSQ
jgi:polar amino acid transport system substrate-binding protein